MSANDTQVAGAHYVKAAYQPWDFTLDVLEGDFFLGNANKYIVRRKGNRAEDLKKAIHYLEKYSETLAQGRNRPHVVLSEPGLHVLIVRYADANDLTLAEETAITLMALGKIDEAIELLTSLVAAPGKTGP